MPTMWFARDGARPHAQSSPRTAISFDEIAIIFRPYKIQFAGREAPSINVDRASHSEKNVLLEVEAEDGDSSHFPEKGFYIIMGCSPDCAKHELAKHRGTV